MSQQPEEQMSFDKGTKVSLKNRFGVLIKGVIKRQSFDGTLVINGDDGARYQRQPDEVVVIGGANDDIDAVEGKEIPKRGRRMTQIMWIWIGATWLNSCCLVKTFGVLVGSPCSSVGRAPLKKWGGRWFESTQGSKILQL